MAIHNISDSVIRRLPRYYRFLGDLHDAGISRISSRELSERMGLTASQIRQDLNCFGGFGQQGYGYNIDLLQAEIGQILGLDRPQSAVLLGAGNLGRALAQHVDFSRRGFHVVGIFDRKQALFGQVIRGLPVRDVASLDDFCRDNHPSVAIMCIPKEEAEPLVDQLVRLGVTGFWNFSHFDIAMKYPQVAVENVHFGDSLMTLSYRLHND